MSFASVKLALRSWRVFETALRMLYLNLALIFNRFTRKLLPTMYRTEDV